MYLLLLCCYITFYSIKLCQVQPPNGGGKPFDEKEAQLSAELVKYLEARPPSACGAQTAEGGMIQLETLVELKFLNSSFSSCFSYW